MKRLATFISILLVCFVFSGSGVMADQTTANEKLNAIEKVVNETQGLNDYEVNVKIKYNRLSYSEAQKVIRELEKTHNDACDLEISKKKLDGRYYSSSGNFIIINSTSD